GFKTRNSSDFVGAVSDDRDSAAAMSFEREGLAAHKAWFFCGDHIACLGAGIRTEQDRPVATTLDQCLLHGEVLVSAGGRTRTLSPGAHERLDHPTWVFHDGVGYLFLE